MLLSIKKKPKSAFYGKVIFDKQFNKMGNLFDHGSWKGKEVRMCSLSCFLLHFLKKPTGKLHYG